MYSFQLDLAAIAPSQAKVLPVSTLPLSLWPGQPQFNGNALIQVEVPLPPLETQHAIVAEIEAEQRLVAANRELVERFEKKIQAALARVWGEEGEAEPEEEKTVVAPAIKIAAGSRQEELSLGKAL